MDQNVQDRLSVIDKDASAMQRELERDHIRKMQVWMLYMVSLNVRF